MKAAKRSDWRTKPLPPKRKTIPLDRGFSRQEIQRMQAGLVPRQMEDKWFAYWEQDTLFLHRSWTGFCIYVVRFVPEADAYRMVQADVNRDPEQYSGENDGHDAEMISYLIDVLLLRRHAEFPCKERNSEKKSVMQWSQIGRAMLGEHPQDD